MFRMSGIIAFQSKKSNLERDLRNKNWHKMSYKGKSEISSHGFLGLLSVNQMQ